MSTFSCPEVSEKPSAQFLEGEAHQCVCLRALSDEGLKSIKYDLMSFPHPDAMGRRLDAKMKCG
eukprot:1159124-Pelagomonas_calceolata.AAC.3